MTDDDRLVVYYHRGEGFAMPVPRTWVLREDPQEKVAVVVAEPEADDGFRANLVVTVDRLEPGQSLDDWQQFTEEVSPRLLDDYVLLDTELQDNGGFAVFRRLAHHVNHDGVPLTMEQWATVRGSRGYTLTATEMTMRLPYSAGLFATVAKGFSTDHDEPDGLRQ